MTFEDEGTRFAGESGRECEGSVEIEDMVC